MSLGKHLSHQTEYTASYLPPCTSSCPVVSRNIRNRNENKDEDHRGHSSRSFYRCTAAWSYCSWGERTSRPRWPSEDNSWTDWTEELWSDLPTASHRRWCSLLATAWETRPQARWRLDRCHIFCHSSRFRWPCDWREGHQRVEEGTGRRQRRHLRSLRKRLMMLVVRSAAKKTNKQTNKKKQSCLLVA